MPTSGRKRKGGTGTDQTTLTEFQVHRKRRKVQEGEEKVEKVADSGNSEETLGKWSTGPTLISFEHSRLEHRARIAAFDFDSTLVTTKRGKGFPQHSGDWKILFSDDGGGGGRTSVVKSKLQELHKEGYKLVVFTNQGGVAKGKISIRELTERIEGFIREVNVPVQVFAATHDDHYRKPAIGMWERLVNQGNGDVEVDMANSFYVGDAAGRPKGWKRGMGRDHSAADRKFSANAGIKFYTPEEYFLNEAPYPVDKCALGFDPKSVDLNKTALRAEDLLPSDRKEREIVVMVGFPASGKSRIAKRYFVEQGQYVHVNRDTLKDVKKCVRVAREALSQGKCVVVDNTSPDIAAREPYIAMAKDLGVRCRCVWMQTPIELAKHLNMMREWTTKGESRHIPSVAYNMYRKRFVAPSEKEGFDEVIQLDWTPAFDTDDQRRQFLHWTESS